MQIASPSFAHETHIPPEFAFAKPDPQTHFTFSDNRNPELDWFGVPDNCRSLALVVVDPDAPTLPHNVNKEGVVVPADLPRADFHHWIMVDIPPTCSGIAAGECSRGVTSRGKKDPPNPAGAPDARQGINDFTEWFAADPQMSGTYFGYDGPAPPWNDQRLHRYHFKLIALDIDTCPVQGEFNAVDALKAMDGHVLIEATLTGTYTMNPELAQV